MIRPICKITILASLFLVSSLTTAQTAPSSSPTQATQTKPTVYVLNFDYVGEPDAHLADFAKQLLILRLAQLKAYTIEQLEKKQEPPCTRENGFSPNESAKTTIGSDAKYYSVKATTRVRGLAKGEVEVVLEYALLKCRKSGFGTSLTSGNNTFPYSDTLPYLNSMADNVAFFLEQEQEVTRIAIDFKGVSGLSYASQLGERLLGRLKEAPEFEPLPATTPVPAEYTISGRVFVQSAKLSFEVEVRNRRGRSFKKLFDGPLQNELNDVELEKFYQEKSMLAVDYLTFVRNVADVDQPPLLNDEEAEKAYRQARELMCKSDPPIVGCSIQAKQAADLLTEVVKNNKYNSFEVWILVAESLSQTSEYARAAASYERAASLATEEGKNAAAVDLLSAAGDNWFYARNHEAAAKAYDRVVKLAPSRTDAHLGRAKSYRYNNEPQRAVESLLESLVVLPDDKELKNELQRVVQTLQLTEVAPAVKALEGKSDMASAKLALQLLRQYQAELVLRQALYLYDHGRYDSLDAKLKEVEEFANQLSKTSDEWAILLTLRGYWHRDARREFDAALRLLREAKPLLKVRGEINTEEVNTEIARTLFERALSADKTAARKDLEEAASILTPDAKVPGYRPQVLFLLVIVNHQLGKDNETRGLLQTLIDARPKHIHAYLNLGFVCNNYLGDPQCGLKVADELKLSRLRDANAYSSLLRAESLTLKGEYDLALSAQQEAVSAQLPAGGNFEFTPIVHFYGVLLQTMKGNQLQLTDSLKEWRRAMGSLRDSDYHIEWVFDGVLRKIEADQSIPANRKAVLRDMISAMQDRQKPLPEMGIK